MILVVVVVVGGPNLYAQTSAEQVWKTYYKPQSYSIDYPTVNGTANITETENNIELISIPDFYIVISSIGSTILDPQEQAVKSRIDDVNEGIETVSEVQPIESDLTIGYGYFTLDQIKFLSTSEMFFETSGTYYHISTAGVTYDNPSIDLYSDRISKVQSSIKFFD